MQKLKAFILSAGYGQRLQPFTDIIPKPLLPCVGVPPLLLNINQLRNYGVKEIAINTHHLADRIETALPTTMGIKIFHEPKLLGTVGFAQNILAWAEDMPLLVYNADIISDIDFAALHATHFTTDAYATLMLLPNPAPNQTCLYTDDQQVTAISRTPTASQPFGFACAQIWSPAFRKDIVDAQHRDLFTALQQALTQKKRLAYRLHTGLWHDLGTPVAILHAHYELLKSLKSNPEYLGITTLLDEPLAICDAGIRVGSPSVASHCRLKPPNYLLHPDISIESGAELHNCLVWEKTTITGKHTNALIMHDMVVKGNVSRGKDDQ